MCICMYIKRGRERDSYCPQDTSRVALFKQRVDLCTYIIHTYVYVHMCICMYTKRWRERYILPLRYESRGLVWMDKSRVGVCKCSNEGSAYVNVLCIHVYVHACVYMYREKYRKDTFEIRAVLQWINMRVVSAKEPCLGETLLKKRPTHLGSQLIIPPHSQICTVSG